LGSFAAMMGASAMSVLSNFHIDLAATLAQSIIET